MVVKSRLFNHSVKKTERYLKAFRVCVKLRSYEHSIHTARLSFQKVGRVIYETLKGLRVRGIEECYVEKKKTLKRFLFRHNKAKKHFHRQVRIVFKTSCLE